MISSNVINIIFFICVDFVPHLRVLRNTVNSKLPYRHHPKTYCSAQSLAHRCEPERRGLFFTTAMNFMHQTKGAVHGHEQVKCRITFIRARNKLLTVKIFF